MLRHLLMCWISALPKRGAHKRSLKMIHFELLREKATLFSSITPFSSFIFLHMNKKTYSTKSRLHPLLLIRQNSHWSLVSVLTFFRCHHSIANRCCPWCHAFVRLCDFHLPPGSYCSLEFCFLKAFDYLDEVRVFPWEEGSVWWRTRKQKLWKWCRTYSKCRLSSISGKRVKMPLKLSADILQKVKNAKYSQYLRVKVEYVWNAIISSWEECFKDILKHQFCSWVDSEHSTIPSPSALPNSREQSFSSVPTKILMQPKGSFDFIYLFGFL